jgi:NADPH2:quinone reductase
MDFATAACFPIVYATSLHALKDRGALKSGETLLVLGAAGGVGLTAVEIGKLMGARVIAAASSEEKLDICRARGADETVNYQTENLKERIKEITGLGADVVIDPVGGRWAEEALRALRFGGRFVCVGFASGEIPRIPLNLVLLKGVIVTGFTMGGFADNQRDDFVRDQAELTELYRSGRFTPHISARYPLEGAGRALADLAERRALGKVLVVPSD